MATQGAAPRSTAAAGASSLGGGKTSAMSSGAQARAQDAERVRRGSSHASSSAASGTPIAPSNAKRRSSTAPNGGSMPPTSRAGGSAAAASSSSSSSAPQWCPQCREMQTSFRCTRCLSAQLRVYRQRVNRVRAICSDAQDRINDILGDVPPALQVNSQSKVNDGNLAQSTHAADHPLAATITLRRPQESPASTSLASQGQDDSAYANSYGSVLPDPFGEPGSEYSHTLSGTSSSTVPSPSTQRSLPPILPHRYAQQSQASHISRTARAERASLLRRLQEARLSLAESRQRIIQLNKEKELRRLTLDRRRSNLDEAKLMLQVDTPLKGTPQAETPVDEGRGWMIGLGRRKMEPVVDSHVAREPDSLGAQVRKTSADIKSLRRENSDLMKELSRTRSILAREAFSLFLVRPASQPSAMKQTGRTAPGWSGLGSSPLSFLPDSMPGAFVSPLRRPGVEGRLNAAAGPRQGMPGRQMPTSASAAAPGATPASAATVSPNWTIVNLPLASPADVRKYPREDINGALSYTSLLLQLLSAYLGISMPFVIESQGGRNVIMPNELWSGTGAKKHIVQLTENAYEALKAINTSSNDRSNDPNGASAFGLGASALSVLESFVQLPSTARLTSMLGPSGSESGNAQQGGIASNGSGGGGTGSSTGTTISSAQQGEAASRSAAVEEYLSVVSMLSYNAAYVAHVQGVRVDLVAAATSPLALLARAMASKTLGVRAHATYAADAHIRNLGRNDMDWSQVRHVLGGSRSSGGGGGGSTSTSGGESVGKSAGAGRMPTVAATSSGKTGASTSTSKATAARTSLAVATARGEPRSRTTANTATTGSATKLSSRRAGQHRSGGGDAAVAEDDWDVV